MYNFIYNCKTIFFKRLKHMILGIVRQNFQVLEMGEYLYKLLPKFCDFKIISLSGLRARTCVPKNGVLGRQIRKKDKL